MPWHVRLTCLIQYYGTPENLQISKLDILFLTLFLSGLLAAGVGGKLTFDATAAVIMHATQLSYHTLVASLDLKAAAAAVADTPRSCVDILTR